MTPPSGRWRFSLAGLLLWVTACALVLAVVAPIYRFVHDEIAGTGHPGSLAVSADGTIVAALFLDGTLVAWRTSDGKQLAQFKVQGGYGVRILLSPDGSTVVIGTDVIGSVMSARRTVEVWRLPEAERIAAIPVAAMSSLALSPEGRWLAIGRGPANVDLYEFSKLNVPPITIACGSSSVSGLSFSPDGRTLAVETYTDPIQLVDVASRAVRSQVGGASQIGTSPTFSADGRTMAAILTEAAGTAGFQRKLAAWRIPEGDELPLPAPPQEQGGVIEPEVIEAVVFLVGRRLLTVCNTRLCVFDFDAQQWRAAAGTPEEPGSFNIQQVAVPAGGKFFATASYDGALLLWNAQTLEPIRTLRQSVRTGPPLVAFIGLGFLFVAWILRRTWQSKRVCQACGKRYWPAGKKDASVDCPACRERAPMQTLTAAQLRRRTRRSLLLLFAFLLFLTVLLAVPMTALLGIWLAAPGAVRFAASALLIFIGLPVLIVVYTLASQRLRLRRLRDESRDWRLAERCAGAPGVVQRQESLPIWSAAGTTLGSVLAGNVGPCRDRLAAVVGSAPDLHPSLHGLVFADRRSCDSYLRALGYVLPAETDYHGVYAYAPARKLVFCEQLVDKYVREPATILRHVILYHLLEQLGQGKRFAWLSEGLAAALAHDDRHGERARLNRRMAAACVAGRALGADDFFPGKLPWRIRKLAARPDTAGHVYCLQFVGQAWSVAEYLCGRAATPERRDAFLHFFNDAERPHRQAATFEKHFGCRFEQLLADWSSWVLSQPAAPHVPPPARAVEQLQRGPVAELHNSATPRRVRIAAVRRLAANGWLLGADGLIELLRTGDEEFRAEALSALEAISGHAWGPDVERWQAWWRDQPEEARHVRSELSG